jgi:hypothetical protein
MRPHTALLNEPCFMPTTYMKQSPSWEANMSSASQENNHGLRRFITAFTNAHHPSLPLHQNNTVHASPSPYFKIHFDILPHLHQGLPSGPFTSGLPIKTLHSHILSPIRATCPTHLIFLDLITQIFGEEQKSWRCLRQSVFFYSHLNFLC